VRRRVLIIPEVRDDLREAEAWYRAIDIRLVARLREEFRSALKHLADFDRAHTFFYRDVRHHRVS
jgi:hypothetical protein